MSKSNPCLAQALLFAKHGYRVLPLFGIEEGKCLCGKPDCSHPGKHPHYHKVDLSQGHNSASTDVSQLEAWWARWPNANLGVALDANTVVIDVDPRNGGDESLARLISAAGELPATFEVQTGGGGRHLWFRNSGEAIGCRCDAFGPEYPGLDIKSHGGYIVAPESAHISGRTYVAREPFDRDTLAEFPTDLRKILAAKHRKSANAIKMGERNQKLFDKALALCRKGADKPQALNALAEIAAQCDPPYDAVEARKIVERVYSYDSETEKPERKSKAKKALELCSEMELFHDDSDVGYAVRRQNGHLETYNIRSTPFAKLLRSLYFSRFKDAIGEELDQTLSALEARAIFDSPRREVFTRIAHVGGSIYVDLGTKDWAVVEVSQTSWRLLLDSPVHFVRPYGFRSLPKPEYGGDVLALVEYINADSDESLVLILAFICGAFMDPQFASFPILALIGEKGSSKSTLARLICRLIDPRKIEVRHFADRDDLLLAASHSKILAIDNIGRITPGQSNDLCRLSTGAGVSKRRLYTDTDEVIIQAKLPLILNGIEDFVTAPDLADRTLFPRLQRIEPSKRMEEREFWQKFERALPQALGFIYSAVSIGLREFDSIKPAKLARMADFHRWSLACESAFGRFAGMFERAYERSTKAATEMALEDSPLAKRIQELVANGLLQGFQGSPTELHALLVNGMSEIEVRGFPKAQTLRSKLRVVAPVLREVGIYVETDVQRSSSKRNIKIQTARESVTSVTSVTGEPNHVESRDTSTLLNDTSMTHDQDEPDEELVRNDTHDTRDTWEDISELVHEIR